MASHKALVLAVVLAAFASVTSTKDSDDASNTEERSIPNAEVAAANQSQVDDILQNGSLRYELKLTMVNHEIEPLKVMQKMLVPDGVEVESFTLERSLANASRQKRRAGQEKMTQRTGGVVNIQPGYKDTAELIYINHPEKILTPNTKTFHKLAVSVTALEEGIIGGEIFTPNYPGNYPNGADITWLISYPAGNVVRLEMLDFSIEECCDHLIIYDGVNKSSRSVLGTFDGDFSASEDNIVVSTGPAIFLRFTSDCLVSGSGFRASYINQQAQTVPTTTEVTQMSCGTVQIYSGNSGLVSSPNYPGSYDNYMNCTWPVQTYYGTRVRFTVNNFYLSSGDYLYFYDGTLSNPGQRLRYLSGSVYSGYTVTASSYRAFLVFTSNSYSTSSGFRVSYEGVSEPTTTETTPLEDSTYYYYSPSQCSGVDYLSFSSSGHLTSPGYYSPYWYPPYESCHWRIQVSSGVGLRFYVHYFYTEYYDDWVYIYNGYSTNSGDRISSLTGYIDAGTVVGITNSRQATVTFDSDCCNNYYRGFHIHVSYTYDVATTASPAETTESSSQSCNGPDYNAGYSGYISSPNYPNYYENYLNCSYWIQTPYGTVAGLTIQSFSLNSGDYLRVYNGYTGSYIRSLGGYYNYGYYVNTYTNYIQLIFTTDYYYTSSGFDIRYSADYDGAYTTASPGDSCGSEMPYNYGTISSPNYPSNYRDDLDCVWTVQVYSNQYVLFTVNYFGTEYCCDYLTFYRGTPSSSQGMGARLKGYYSPGTEILISSNDAYVSFHTDGSVTEKGFSISYSPVNTNYEANSNGSSTTVEPPPYDSTGWRVNSEERFGKDKIFGRDLWEGAKNRPPKKEKRGREEEKP